MANFDFDTPINRYGTNCLKFDNAEKLGKSNDLLSMWVADMDFVAPQPILDRVHKRTDHGVFGYTRPGDDYLQSVVRWMQRYRWTPKAEWIVTTPGVVFALAMAVRAFTNPGDSVLIQQPVYYPFSNVVTQNGRSLVNVVLKYFKGRYYIDFDAFERAIVQHRVKLFLLCNPHNPVGRLWTVEELQKIADICMRHDVLVASDEIHMDFARPGFTHTVFATLSAEIEQHCLICTAASKTFNLAGLEASNIFIPNDLLRDQYKRVMQAGGVFCPNLLGLEATQAAYEECEDWLAALKDYLEGNWELAEQHLQQYAPQLHLVPAESTYLAWIDCRATGLYGEALRRLIEDEAGLWLDLGDMFGPDGDGFIRINLATQRNTVQQALTQLTDAISKLNAQ